MGPRTVSLRLAELITGWRPRKAKSYRSRGKLPPRFRIKFVKLWLWKWIPTTDNRLRKCQTQALLMSSPHSEVKALAQSVTKKYGLNQCRECATKLRSVLAAAGKKGCVLRLKTKGGRGYIVMKDPHFNLPFRTLGDASISDSRLHFGVQVGGYVFDNVHREGILRTSWEETFDCDVHSFDVTEIEPF